MSAITLSEALTLFDDALYGEVKTRTQKWYTHHLDSLTDFFSPDTPISKITATGLRRWRRDVFEQETSRGQPPAIDTKNAYLKSVKRFFSWLEEEGLIVGDPSSRLHFVKEGAFLPKAISMSDFAKLREMLENEGRVRDLAIIHVMLDTGCRVSTIARLTLGQIDFDQGMTWVVEKGRGRGKGRWLYFQPITLYLIRRYLDRRPDIQRPELFLSVRKRPLTNGAIGQMLANAGVKAKCTGPVNPHAFRHAFAIEMLKSGVPLSVVSELLGHSDIKTTHKYYGRWEQSVLQDMHRQHSPLNRLNLTLPGQGRE